MAKRRLLEWMREKLNSHASKIVLPVREKKALDTAYAKAAPLVAAIVQKKFPPAEMKMLAKWKAAAQCKSPKLQLPNGVVLEFKFADDEGPLRPDQYDYRGQIYLANSETAVAVERWRTAVESYDNERKARLVAYEALIRGASYVEDIVEIWPEVKGILPAGSPPIPLGPEQIALVKADLRERKAA